MHPAHFKQNFTISVSAGKALKWSNNMRALSTPSPSCLQQKSYLHFFYGLLLSNWSSGMENWILLSSDDFFFPCIWISDGQRYWEKLTLTSAMKIGPCTGILGKGWEELPAQQVPKIITPLFSLENEKNNSCVQVCFCLSFWDPSTFPCFYLWRHNMLRLNMYYMGALCGFLTVQYH